MGVSVKLEIERFFYGVLNVLIFVAMAGVMANTETAVFANTQQGERLSVANTKFAVDLYKRISPADQNIFMSPLSISVALAMTYLGARGQTKSQMKDVLHFIDVEERHLHQAFSDIVSHLNSSDEAYKLYMANCLFGEKSYTFLDEFLAAGLEYYSAALASVDFRHDSNGAAAIINDWVAEKTNKKITEIVPAGALDDLTRLILVNAIYFKGDWLEKFNVTDTKDDDFHISSRESVKVKMMYMKADFYYGENAELKCQAIELPYAGGNISMFVLLPDQESTQLSEVQQKLTSNDLVDIKEKFQMTSEEVNLWLPRFNLDEKLSLADMLAGMGMKDLFIQGVSDLSGMDGSKELYVSKVLHRAVVEVNEEGTEAAAATAVVMMLCSMIEKEINFRANRPFLFFIQDKATRSILFLGRLTRPPSAVASKAEL